MRCFIRLALSGAIYFLLWCGCATRKETEIRLQTPQIINWPEEGWVMYPSLGTGSGIGSVYGTTRTGERSEIDDVEIQRLSETEDHPITVIDYQYKAAVSRLFAQYALEPKPGNIDLSFTNKSTISIQLTISGGKRLVLKGRRLQDAIETLDITPHDFDKFETFWIRSSVETATNLVFKLNQEAANYFNGQLKVGLIAGANGGGGTYSTNGATIVVTSTAPLNIAYKPTQVEKKWWLELNSRRNEGKEGLDAQRQEPSKSGTIQQTKQLALAKLWLAKAERSAEDADTYPGLLSKGEALELVALGYAAFSDKENTVRILQRLADIALTAPEEKVGGMSKNAVVIIAPLRALINRNIGCLDQDFADAVRKIKSGGFGDEVLLVDIAQEILCRHFDKAEDWCRRLPPSQRIEILCQIGTYRNRTGDPQGALRTLFEAKRVAFKEFKDSSYQVSNLGMVVRALAENNWFVDAENCALEAENIGGASRLILNPLFVELASQYARHGEMQNAERLKARSSDPSLGKDDVYVETVKYLAAKTNFVAALSAMEKIEFPIKRAIAESQIAFAYYLSNSLSDFQKYLEHSSSAIAQAGWENGWQSVGAEAVGRVCFASGQIDKGSQLCKFMTAEQEVEAAYLYGIYLGTKRQTNNAALNVPAWRQPVSRIAVLCGVPKGLMEKKGTVPSMNAYLLRQ